MVKQLQTPLLLLLSLFWVGCGAEPEPSADAGEAIGEESQVPPVSRGEEQERIVQLGTHDLGESNAEGWRSLEDEDSLPIVYGPQGAYMVILSLRADKWASINGTISVSLVFQDETVASLYYPDASVETNTEDEGVYIWNLFVLTNGWDAYAEEDVNIQVEMLGAGEFATDEITIRIETPGFLFGE